MQCKDLVEKALQHFGVIYVPRVLTELEQTPLMMVSGTAQKPQRVAFDSFKRVDKKGSIIDFVITKNRSELLFGLWDSDFKLTEQHKQLIISSGRSYLALHTSELTKDNMERAIKLGDIRHSLGQFKGNLKVIEWVNHSRYGWQYEK